jgi:hypothetical protein
MIKFLLFMLALALDDGSTSGRGAGQVSDAGTASDSISGEAGCPPTCPPGDTLAWVGTSDGYVQGGYYWCEIPGAYPGAPSCCGGACANGL